MPLYEYRCQKCSKSIEILAPIGVSGPDCCGEVITRRYSLDTLRIKMGPPLWTERMDEIHKAQADRGERLRFVHPSEIGAN